MYLTPEELPGYLLGVERFAQIIEGMRVASLAEYFALTKNRPRLACLIQDLAKTDPRGGQKQQLEAVFETLVGETYQPDECRADQGAGIAEADCPEDNKTRVCESVRRYRRAARPDVRLSGGRSGQGVKNLVGPPNSAVKGGGERIFVTNGEGEIVLDITRDRVKEVIPGVAFGPKRSPNDAENKLLDQYFGGRP